MSEHFCAMVQDIFSAAADLKRPAPKPAVACDGLIANSNSNENDNNLNNSSNNIDTGGTNSSSTNNNMSSRNADQLATKVREASSPSSVMTAPLSPPSGRAAGAEASYESAHELDTDDYNAMLEFLEFGEDDSGNGSNNKNADHNDSNKNNGDEHDFPSTGKDVDHGDQQLGKDNSSTCSDRLDFDFDPNNEDPSYSFISLLPDATPVSLPVIPSFDAVADGPPDDDGVLPAAPDATSFSFAANTGTTCEDGENAASPGAAAEKAGAMLPSDPSTSHAPSRAAAPVMVAPRTRQAAPMSVGAKASATSTDGQDGRSLGEEAAAASLKLVSKGSTCRLSAPHVVALETEAPRASKAASFSAGDDAMQKNWGVSGAFHEMAEQGPVAPAPTPSLQDLHQTTARHPAQSFSFPEALSPLSMTPTPMCHGDDMVSALASALDINCHISEEFDGRKTDFSREVSHRHSQTQIASALKAAAEKKRPPPVPPGIDTVVDALADCLEYQMLLKERTPTEEENAFSDGVAVRGNLGRAIKAVKSEDRRRREVEARAILEDVKRRSSSRRLRSAGLSKDKGGKRKTPPKWDLVSLRKEWKAGNLVTL